ncbi:HrpJ domain-containing protein [Herbaspirillum sp. RTI4]|nr:HrpJ domain-containing protein [Herbaspirillum sp. RTI4]MDY7578361.1 HrpJ domain-containing protein [Herbaspirillum sp. RTI4]
MAIDNSLRLQSARSIFRNEARNSKLATQADIKLTSLPSTTHSKHIAQPDVNMLDDMSMLMASMSRRVNREDRKLTAINDRFSKLLEENSETGLQEIGEIVLLREISARDLLQFSMQRFPDISDLILALEHLLEQYGQEELERSKELERRNIADALALARLDGDKKK